VYVGRMRNAAAVLAALLVAALLAGCGDGGTERTTSTAAGTLTAVTTSTRVTTTPKLPMVDPPILHRTEAKIDRRTRSVFAHVLPGGTRVGRPRTTCVAFTAADVDFACTTVARLRAGHGERCRLVSFRQRWKARWTPADGESWARDGVPRRAGATACPAPRPVRGRGRLLAPVLVYRDVEEQVDGGKYLVFFRVAKSFSGKNNVGEMVPGELRVEDVADTNDGFFGSFGLGTTAGKCYWWVLWHSPHLNRVPVGEQVKVALHLHRTSAQRTTATMREIPQDNGSAWESSPTLARDLAAIGCPLPEAG